MGNLVLMRILNARDNLLEYFSGLIFGQLFPSRNQVEQLSTSRVFENHEYLRLRIDEFKQFNGVRVVESTENLQLSLYFFKNTILSYFLLVKNLDRHFMSSLLMESHFDFTEGAVS